MSPSMVEEQILHNYTQSGRKQIRGITGLRGVAALWVVMFHYIHITPVSPQIMDLKHKYVVNRGYLGVDLFFILSGFVLFLTYSQRMENPNCRNVRHFFISRIWRVYPLHLAVLLGFVIIYLASDARLLLWGSGPYTVKSFIEAALLVQSWVMAPQIWNLPTWSLSDELLAYILFPLLTVGVSRVARWEVALGLALGAFVVMAGMSIMSPDLGFDHIRRAGIMRCLIEFPAGMLLCRMMELKNFGREASSRLFYSGCLVFILAMYSVKLDALCLVAFSLLILSCATGSLPANRVFANPICFWLGEVSFSIYILHYLFYEVADQIAVMELPNSPAAAFMLMGIAAILVFPAAYLTWRFIEVPGQAYGRLLSKTAPIVARSGRGAPEEGPVEALRES